MMPLKQWLLQERHLVQSSHVLNSTINNLSVAIENASTSKSRIKDVDFASETANMTQNRILTQAGVSVLGQASQLPEMALSLL